MQSFRASPWVSYDPSANAQHTRDPHVSGSEMDEDVDMEAPQISILKEEDTPPPVHRKAAANLKKRPAPSTATSAENRGRVKEDGEAEDEEDQLVDELIDDDSVDPSKDASRSTDTGPKRKAPAKKKARKEKKPGEGDKKAKDKVTTSEGGGHTIAPTISIFKANPAEPGDDIGSPASIGGLIDQETPTGKGKKKASPRKPAASRAKPPAKVSKQKLALPNLTVEDAGTLSESYAGTAASSPVTGTFEPNTPEPEQLPPSSPPPSAAPPLEEPPNLENVAIPIYPLPTKPFPVQPPPKIPSGFAPLIPLDKSTKRVRHWREANREIRGIGGGRWLVNTWVGDKESDLATHLATVGSQPQAQAKLGDDKPSGAGLVLPKLPALSVSAPTKKGASRLKGSSKAGSTVTSANPSRAPSVVPDVNPPSSIVKAPSKMRISQQAPSEAGDSVADGPAGS